MSQKARTTLAAQLGQRRTQITSNFEKMEAYIESLKNKSWNEATFNLMLNGPLIQSAKVALVVDEAVNLARQCRVMLDMLPSNNALLVADDLDDVELVLTKTENKAHNAETEILEEEERRAIEEAKFVKKLEHEKIQNAKREDEERRAQLMKVMEEEERLKELERERAAKERAAAKARLEKQAKLNEQKRELEARFKKLNKTKQQIKAKEQHEIDDFTKSIFKSTAIEERHNDLVESRTRLLEKMRDARAAKALQFRAKLRLSVKSKMLLARIRTRLSSTSNSDYKQAHGASMAATQEQFLQLQARLKDHYKSMTTTKASRREIRQQLMKEVTQDDDDDDFEKKDRETARTLVQQYEGGPFRAAREDNAAMLRAYLLVDGPRKVLSLRDKSKEGGGRTLLHTAAWWGSNKVVEYLAQIGADVNAIDTTYNKITPLLEATRAGRRRACEILLQHGARLDHQDAQGNTVFHWCARQGWGTLPMTIITQAEALDPGVAKGVMRIRNLKGKLPVEVHDDPETAAELVRTFSKFSLVATAEPSPSPKSKKSAFRRKFKDAKRHNKPMDPESYPSLKAQHQRYGKLRSGAPLSASSASGRSL